MPEFAEIDTNKDGVISPGEFIAHLDANKDGVISKEEFNNFMAPPASAAPKPEDAAPAAEVAEARTVSSQMIPQAAGPRLSGAEAQAALARALEREKLHNEGKDGVPAEMWYPIGSGLKTEYKILTPGGFYGDETRTGAEEDVVEFGAKAVNMHAYVCVDGVPPQKVWHTKEEGGGPVTYEPGEGNVILGWDHGALGMRVGEVRELLIPSEEAYGEAGFPAWGIPTNAQMRITLTCLKVVWR
jgi:hypothetical protein